MKPILSILLFCIVGCAMGQEPRIVRNGNGRFAIQMWHFQNYETPHDIGYIGFGYKSDHNTLNMSDTIECAVVGNEIIFSDSASAVAVLNKHLDIIKTENAKEDSTNREHTYKSYKQ